MNTKVLLLACSIIGFASCATFKSGQTPDDVYYSPAKKYTQNEENKDEVKNKRKTEEYNYEDRSLRMRTTDRRWATLENPYYAESYRYNHNCNCDCNQYNYYNSKYGFYNNGYYWNNSYRNYYGNGYYWQSNVAYTPAKPKYIAPRGGTYSNGRTYNNNTYSNNNNTNTTNSKGSTIIGNIFGNSNSNSGNAQPVRSYEPSNSNSSSSGSSSSGSSSSGSGSRPSRSGN
jgi:hypothetical protein